jgi:spermidine synthase
MDSAQRPASAVRTALVLIGLSAVIGQIVLMRELIVVFNGNEMALGITLASWLSWTATGSWLCSLALGSGNARRPVIVLECLLAASLLPAIWIVRASKSFIQTVPGELVGPLPMLLVSLVCLGLFCVVAGALFVAAARLYETECHVSASMAAGSAYLLEAAGSAIGGLVASIVLLRYLDSFQIATIVALVNLCMAAVLALQMNRRQVVLCAGLSAVIAIPLLLVVAPSLNNSALARLWHGFHLIESRDTIYGNLAVTQTADLRSIYDNGMILASAPDENAAEEAVHYALLEHPAPRRVLLIGGGVNGSIAQALKHPSIQQIDYVELDPALIHITQQFFPAQAAAANSDPRVHIHLADGRRYLKTTSDRFDAVIVEVPDPQTAQLNRFYTSEFFLSARHHLAPGGLLALALHSSEENISPDLADFLRCIQHTLNQVFPYIAVIPGDTIHFFGAMQPDVLTEDPQVLIARLQARRLNTKYVREYFIPYRMTLDRMSQVDEQLRPLASTPVNRDFAPIAYYFDVVLWSSQFRSGFLHWYRTAAHVSFRSIFGAALLVLSLSGLLIAFAPAHQERPRSAAMYCTLATGFTLMALQIFLLLAFESVYGYVYQQLAILIGLFMAGIAFGSWLGVRRIRSHSNAVRSMATTQLLLTLSCPMLIFSVSLLSGVSGSATTWLAAQLVFPALAALSGMLGGYQFPIAADIYLHGRDGQSGLGKLYAIDLLGGCAGALLLSSYLIPVFGFWKTACLCTAINLVPAALALRVSLQSRALRA